MLTHHIQNHGVCMLMAYKMEFVMMAISMLDMISPTNSKTKELALISSNVCMPHPFLFSFC